jgi:hypothetical protein
MSEKEAINCLHNMGNSNYVQIPNYSQQDATFLDFNVYGSVHRKNILIYRYIQQDATLHSLFYL